MKTSETELEKLIVDYLRDKNGYEQGTPHDYNKDWAMVDAWVERFITETQADKVQHSMCFISPTERTKFFNRLSQEISKRGVSDVLRKGYKFNGQTFDLYYPLPSELNPTAQQYYEKNIFGVIRQVMYSKHNNNEIDFVVFMNGLPLATFELKNSLTGQTVENAIAQYKKDRKPEGEILLQKKRCAVHMAVDDTQIYMCTELKGEDSWFLPFNRGVNGGAGNPVIPGKTMTSYLWEEVLTKHSLSNIIENFAQVIEKTEHKKENGVVKTITKEQVIWPRYHQLDAVRSLLGDTLSHTVGRKYLIQHSAGSGKSNSISWLAYQLVLLLKNQQPMFDSVIVVTDRVNLDKQIRDNINGFKKLQNLVGWADKSATLRELLVGGKKIIISTIHKFSFILDEIGTTLKDRHFAIIIDEAHSSQNGSMSTSMSTAVSGHAKAYEIPASVTQWTMAAAAGVDASAEDEVEELDTEDRIINIIKGRKMAHNANYYAFTATPKNKTLEMFGTPYTTESGEKGFRPFHEYTMKQAIEEGFILDVLRYYTPYSSYYKVTKATQDDPQFDKKKALGKIRAYIEAQPETIQRKAEIIVDHFCTKVFKKIRGKARAMVVTSSIERAIAFYRAITDLLEQHKSQYKAIVAFTDKVIDGQLVTEASLNGFPSAEIEDKIAEEPYRILVVADKFQTGYDQPLMHTMYVDKQLSDLKAVQTLSRLNRCHPGKQDTFVLDFCNDPEAIRESFQRYYKATLLEGESDVNKLNDLIDTVEEYNFYTETDVEQLVNLWLTGKEENRPQMDSLLDAVAERFRNELDEDAQIACKSAIKNYCRIYPFFAAIMPFESVDWENLYIFYSLLVKKLPKLKMEDFTKGLLENVDFEKYRLVKEEERQIELENKDEQVKPVPVGSGAGKPEPELDFISNIIQDFNDKFGKIDWKNSDEVQRQVEELPARMARNESFVNAVRGGDAQNMQIAFHDVIISVVAAMLEEKTEFVEHYFNNPDFQRYINEKVMQASIQQIAKQASPTIITDNLVIQGDAHIDKNFEHVTNFKQ